MHNFCDICFVDCRKDHLKFDWIDCVVSFGFIPNFDHIYIMYSGDPLNVWLCDMTPGDTYLTCSV